MRLKDQIIEMHMDGYRAETISDMLEVDVNYVKMVIRQNNKKLN